MPYQRLGTYFQIIQISGKWKRVYVDLEPSVGAFWVGSSGGGLGSASGSPWAFFCCTPVRNIAWLWLSWLYQILLILSPIVVFSPPLFFACIIPGAKWVSILPLSSFLNSVHFLCSLYVNCIFFFFFLPHCCLLAYSHYAHYALGEKSLWSTWSCCPILAIASPLRIIFLGTIKSKNWTLCEPYANLCVQIKKYPLLFLHFAFDVFAPQNPAFLSCFHIFSLFLPHSYLSHRNIPSVSEAFQKEDTMGLPDRVVSHPENKRIQRLAVLTCIPHWATIAHLLPLIGAHILLQPFQNNNFP